MTKFLGYLTLFGMIAIIAFGTYDIYFAHEPYPAGAIFVSNNGDDLNDGLSTKSPIKTIFKLNEMTSGKESVKVLFERGSVFRQPTDAYLNIVSGNLGDWSKYSHYGSKAKPLPSFYGSIEANSGWKNLGNNIWQFPDSEQAIIGNEMFSNPSFDENTVGWSIHTIVGTTAEWTTTEYDSWPAGLKLNIASTGGSSDTQIYTTNLNIEEGKTYKLTFRAKASNDMSLYIKLMRRTDPWTNYASESFGANPTITTTWGTYETYFTSSVTTTNARLTFYNIASLPASGSYYMDTLSMKEVTGDISVRKDVGNIIFNNGEGIGFKKWSEESLINQGDFYMVDYYKNQDYSKLLMYSTQDPSIMYDDIEFALKTTLIDIGSRRYVEINGIDVRFGGVHGIGGSSANDITLRNNNFYIVGGSLQYYRDGMPVRYGNCVEFGCGSDNILVENNMITQCYDAGLSSQSWSGCGTAPITNTRYTGNIVLNCHYGWEYFYSDVGGMVNNISIDHNTILGSGYELWYHQRPDGGFGQGMRLSRSPPNTANYVVKDNLIAFGRDYAIMQGSNSEYNWPGELYMGFNLYYNNRKLIYYGTTEYTNLDDFTLEKNKEHFGMVANPNLVGYTPQGPACSMSSTGSYVGALPCI